MARSKAPWGWLVIRFAVAMAAVALVGCAPANFTEADIAEAAKSIDYGDFTSQTLTTKAWEAFGDKNYPEVFAYARKCEELYGEEGKKMNAAMTKFEPSSTASQKWALNDVGTSLFIMAESYINLERYPEAVAIYRRLVEDYGYAQCWDPKGWYWKPAEVAESKIEIYKDRP